MQALSSYTRHQHNDKENERLWGAVEDGVTVPLQATLLRSCYLYMFWCSNEELNLELTWIFSLSYQVSSSLPPMTVMMLIFGAVLNLLDVKTLEKIIILRQLYAAARLQYIRKVFVDVTCVFKVFFHCFSDRSIICLHYYRETCS